MITVAKNREIARLEAKVEYTFRKAKSAFKAYAAVRDRADNAFVDLQGIANDLIAAKAHLEQVEGQKGLLDSLRILDAKNSYRKLLARYQKVQARLYELREERDHLRGVYERLEKEASELEQELTEKLKD